MPQPLEKYHCVWLQDAAGSEAYVQRCLRDRHIGLFGCPGSQGDHDAAEDLLVPETRARGHDDLPIDQLHRLVALWERQKFGLGD